MSGPSQLPVSRQGQFNECGLGVYKWLRWLVSPWSSTPSSRPAPCGTPSSSGSCWPSSVLTAGSGLCLLLCCYELYSSHRWLMDVPIPVAAAFLFTIALTSSDSGCVCCGGHFSTDTRILCLLLRSPIISELSTKVHEVFTVPGEGLNSTCPCWKCLVALSQLRIYLDKLLSRNLNSNTMVINQQVITLKSMLTILPVPYDVCVIV